MSSEEEEVGYQHPTEESTYGTVSSGQLCIGLILVIFLEP